jgi:hypothetical protein
MSSDKSMGLRSINSYVNFGLTENNRNWNRTSVSNCLYSVTQYNGSAHIELNFSRDLQGIHRLHFLGLHAAWLVNNFKVLRAQRCANSPSYGTGKMLLCVAARRGIMSLLLGHTVH